MNSSINEPALAKAQALDALLGIALTDLSDSDALARLGELVDLSFELSRSDGTDCALTWCEALDARKLSAETRATLDYFRSNAWANKAALRRSASNVWSWEQPEHEQQVYFLRRALNNSSFDTLHSGVRCQILTNLANQLNSLGRFVEAIAYWSRAIQIDANFFMALGNRGYGLFEYGKAVYDDGHRWALICAAHRDLTRALSITVTHDAGYGNARPAFTSLKESIEKRVNVAELSMQIDLDDHSLGDTPEEVRYRKWSLHHRLYLNPLNDIGAHAIAARDILTLPSFTTSLDEPPSLIGFYNQMKQEFASARWLCYEGQHSGPHFSDSDVFLYDTLDYPAYGLAHEKTRIAYRMAYSLLDKVAYFLNAYLKLGMNPKQVSFRSIWREKQGAPIRPQLDQSENWPLRGLYWLSKDIFEETYRDVMDPDAAALNDVRNHLEHKYLKLHEMLMHRHDSLADNLAHSLSVSDFEKRTLRILQQSRAALIYLSLGMHREESRRSQKRTTGFTMPMSLPQFEEERKR